MKHILLFLALFCFLVKSGQSQTRIMVLGTSIEAGLGAPTGHGWVNVFGKLLGPQYTVLGRGRPNTTYMNIGTRPIWSYIHDASIANANPDIIIVGGPTNDNNSNYYPAADTLFPQDYHRFLDSLVLWWPTAHIILCTAIPSLHILFPQYRFDGFVNPLVIEEAKERHFRVINFAQRGISILDQYGIHPDSAGHAKMGKAAYDWFRGFNKGDSEEAEPGPSIFSIGEYPIIGNLWLQQSGKRRYLVRK